MTEISVVDEYVFPELHWVHKTQAWSGLLVEKDHQDHFSDIVEAHRLPMNELYRHLMEVGTKFLVVFSWNGL